MEFLDPIGEYHYRQELCRIYAIGLYQRLFRHVSDCRIHCLYRRHCDKVVAYYMDWQCGITANERLLLINDILTRFSDLFVPLEPGQRDIVWRQVQETTVQQQHRLLLPPGFVEKVCRGGVDDLALNIRLFVLYEMTSLARRYANR